MNALMAQLKTIWERMEISQRVTLVLLLAVFLAVLELSCSGASRPDLRVRWPLVYAWAQTTEIAAYLDQQGVRLISWQTVTRQFSLWTINYIVCAMS